MDNKQLVGRIMAALAMNDRRPLLDALAEDATWRWMGVESWSKTFQSKAEIIDQLFGGVDATLESSTNSTTVRGIYADGNHVIVEHTGSNETPDGRAYNNNYCWVFHVDDGRIYEVREYMDTQLVSDTFTKDRPTVRFRGSDVGTPQLPPPA